MKLEREVKDPIVAENMEFLADRSAVGIIKYGSTLESNPINLQAWLEHIREELADGLNYTNRAIHEVNEAPTPFRKVSKWCVDFDANHDPNFWMGLILEEFTELFEAWGLDIEIKTAVANREWNAVEILDAAIDLPWVIMGLCFAAGWDWDKAFQEVYRSNMSKKQNDGTVLKDGVGKIMKGPNYSPPDLKGLV